ncbi:NADAR family protein [Aminobacter sp. Piv2-1]|uniref:NADAR family protein n=1 Tax=Aminobacter sp. Piv2-1 TaxID=3031122 RepID=UPI00309E7188
MYRNRSQLEDAYRAKASLQFLFFWGHQPSRDGRITSSCLSQWWPASFEMNGLRYPSAEHWMMAEKARLFGDQETASKILAAESPKQAKQFGRGVRGFDPAIWDREKARIVTEGSKHKFGQNLALRDFLLSTGSAILVEASPVDPVWGIGLAAEDVRASNPLQWGGENLLGFALMEARESLRG